MASLPSAENAMVLQTKTDEDEKGRFSRSYREMISTFPTEKGSKIHDLMYQYQGFWYDSIFSLSPSQNVELWLKSLMFAIMNRTRYDFSAHPLLSSNSHQLVPSLGLYFYHNIPFPNQDTLSPPHLFHTHSPFTSLPQSVIDS
ncbi:hypothetical protein PVL29_017611 [Vitis rotundifolia]|uniref:Sulfotransferase n=1 Tax=Vitis rotundifolia TaxID=103349 RepID=A0AA39DKR1_VITRO|nr:hypothetical protein PVL29_017611 [Vitis rotundifolia]